MAGATYDGCTYEGGFQGMKPSGEARLTVTGDQFVLRRPRVFFSRSLYKLWAKWTAVTELEVEAADAGSRLQLTTKARGSGTIVVPDVTPDELWGVLDELADLRERFHQHDGAVAAGAQSDKAESDKTESGKAEPGEAESDKAEPGRAESDKAEPDKAESDKAEPDKAESDNAEPEEAEPEEAEPEEAEPEEAEVAKTSGSSPEDSELGDDVTGDAGDAEAAAPAGDEPQGAAARQSLLGEDITGDAGAETEAADHGEVPGATP